MGGKLGLVLYLQRLIGYSLTALTTEHVLAFFYGGGRNGKSTFVQTLRTILGEYACAAPRDLLFEKKQGDGHPAELARLYGKRFAVCAEIGEHTILDEAKVKDLTGGDVISARRMREDFWDLVPTHTLFISGNHKPTVRGDDLGIWRRIRLVPWTVTVDDAAVDKDLPEKLKAEGAGILRWAVLGCIEWAEIGLQEPDEVIDATREYRQESDVFGDFLKMHAVFGADEKCHRATFRERYEAWCEEDGHKPLGAKKIAQRLHEHGVRGASVRVGHSVKNGWVGVRLKTDLELQIAALASEKKELPKAS
jgi:putative DNA primase/helicase